MVRLIQISVSKSQATNVWIGSIGCHQDGGLGLSFCNCPNRVKRHSRRIRLQHEDTRPSHSIRIILDDDGAENPANDVICQYIVFRKFVIAVVRNANGSSRHKRLNSREGVVQLARISLRYSAASLAPPRRRGLPAFFSTGSKNLPV